MPECYNREAMEKKPPSSPLKTAAQNFLASLQRLFSSHQQDREEMQTIADLNHFEIMAPERTADVLREIGRVFTTLTEKPQSKFGFSKNKDYYFSYYDFSAFDFVTSFCNHSKKTKIAILLIGTSDTTFATHILETFGERVTVTLLAPTASPTNAETNSTTQIPESEVTIVIGNAEHLYTLFPTNMFDLIISAHVFNDFVDPLGTLQQIYQSLAPEGVVLIDEFHLHGIQDQLPTLVDSLNNAGGQIVVDYTYGIRNRALSIEGIRCFIAKKTLPTLTIPGIIYSGIHDDPNPEIQNYIIYVLNPPLTSFRKQVSAETEAFLNFIRELIPSISEQAITQFLFNTYIMNNRFNRLEENVYTKALQTSLVQLLKTYNISEETHQVQIQQALSMIPHVAKWIDITRSREEFQFLTDIYKRIGLDLPNR
jgi:ubiquinone/menaquinone biosynthesis C-methylase UbiE